MPKLSQYELEREANIARNRALLEELDLKQAITELGLPANVKPPPKTKAKPIQPAKKAKREAVVPTRQSARLRKSDVADPNESPSKKRKREAEREEKRKREEENRLEAEELARVAKRPRHQDLELSTLAENAQELELSSLNASFQVICRTRQPKLLGDPDAFVFEKDKEDDAAVADLREKLDKLQVVARAKVTENRIYSAAYHPEITKDLIFFGDKHGQLGIWDARAPQNEVPDEDDAISPEDKEGGKYWRLQAHWPATSKSSISCIKFDPIDSHSLYTSSYDCTIRSLSFTSGVSREIFSTDDVLISSIDLPPNGNEMWISDALGGVTHLDLREDRSKARRYGLSEQKIGSVSINPTNPCLLLTASNNRWLKMWDSRKLQSLAVGILDAAGPPTPPPSSPGGPPDYFPQPEFPLDIVTEFANSKRGKGCLRLTSEHSKSVSSAYWDPRGRSIVSTSYDDQLRLWDVSAERYKDNTSLSQSKPFCRIRHNCQTGKWLTILRAQWTSNPDVYPHFTIGNMEHSLDIFSGKGTLIARLSDRKRITAVQAVTCSHPNVLERAASGNASGRCVLWAPADV